MEIKLGSSADETEKPEEDFAEEAATEAAKTLADALRDGDGTAIVRQLRLVLDLLKD